MGHALVLEHVEKCHVIYGQPLNLLFSALEVIAAMSDVGQDSTRQIKDKTRPEDTSVKSEPPSQQESIKMRIPLIFGVFSSLGLCQSFSLSETTQGIHILY